MITGEQEGASAPAYLTGHCFDLSSLMQALTCLGHTYSPLYGLGNAAQRFLLEAPKLHPLRSGLGQFWSPDLRFMLSLEDLTTATSRASWNERNLIGVAQDCSSLWQPFCSISRKTSLLSAIDFARHGLLKSDPLTLPLLLQSFPTEIVPAGNDSRPSANHPQQDLLLEGVKHFQSSSTKQSW